MAKGYPLHILWTRLNLWCFARCALTAGSGSKLTKKSLLFRGFIDFTVYVWETSKNVMAHAGFKECECTLYHVEHCALTSIEQMNSNH